MSPATATEKRSLKSVNPYNGEVLKTYEEMTPDAVDAAIGKADASYREWRETSYEHRAEILRKVAKLLRERRDELAKIMTLEMGKKIGDSLPEIDLCATIFDYYADEGAKILAPKEYKTFEGEGTLVHQPTGIVYGIQPWNFPFYQPSRASRRRS